MDVLNEKRCKKMPIEENKNDIKDEYRETKLEKKPESISDISLV